LNIDGLFFVEAFFCENQQSQTTGVSALTYRGR